VSARRDEVGSAAVELAVLAPVLVILLLLVVMVGRLVLARQAVDAAAADAARAASITDAPGYATAAAQSAAGADLSADGISCSSSSVSVDTAAFYAGGAVSVSLSCTASFAGLSLLHIPGSATLRSTAAAPVDRYRSVGTGAP